MPVPASSPSFEFDEDAEPHGKTHIPRRQPPGRLQSLAPLINFWSTRTMRILLAAVTFSVLTFCASLPRAQDVQQSISERRAGQTPWPSLKFTNDGTFHISVFADLHFGENAWDQWGPQQDINSVKVMNEVLDAESQQLVVLNGDLITGENAYLFNSTKVLDEIVAPIVQRGLPFATTYGNHDSQFNLSGMAILRHEHRYRNSLTRKMVTGPNAGVTNYYLPVYPSNGSQTPSLLLWFFDSRGGFKFQQRDANGNGVGQPDWVDQSVVTWFQNTNAQLTSKYGKAIPSLAFVHIPTYASNQLQTKIGVDSHREPGINDDNPLAPQAQGWCSDNVSNGTCAYGGQDIPFMQAITSTPGLMAVFSGHDHGDTWCYKWNQTVPGMSVKGNGVNLCFNQHSGYGGYGTWTRGARQIYVTEKSLQNHVAQTWIRLETGGVVGKVTLNSTYGSDVYPATPETHTSCPTCNYSDITPMPGTRAAEPAFRAAWIAQAEQALAGKIQQWLQISGGNSTGG